MKRKPVGPKASDVLSLKSNAKTIRKRSLPFYEKYLLTVEETTIYYHIGAKKLTQLIKDNPKAKWILMNGKRTMIKRNCFPCGWISSRKYNFTQVFWRKVTTPNGSATYRLGWCCFVAEDSCIDFI